MTKTIMTIVSVAIPRRIGSSSKPSTAEVIEIGDVIIPRHTQYALRLESDVKVVITFGRLDTSSEKLAYYVGVAFSY